MSGQLNNFLSGFPGHPESPFYCRALAYMPGTKRLQLPAMTGTVIAAPLSAAVAAEADSKFAVLDPNGDLTDQLAFAISLGYRYVEIGAPVAYRLGQFMEFLTHTHGLGIGVIARNAALYAPYQYLSHPNVFGCVVERAAGSPLEYDRLRREVRKDGLMPVWFVYDGSEGADGTAEEIRLHNLKGMGVSFAAGLSARYDDSHSVLTPFP